jgi:hypothetical protein
MHLNFYISKLMIQKSCLFFKTQHQVGAQKDAILKEESVSREDFRSVCAVLLEGEDSIEESCDGESDGDQEWNDDERGSFG